MEEKKNGIAERLVFIDILESLSMLLVIHYHLEIQPGSLSLGNGSEFSISYLMDCLSSVSVPLFMLCNGFLLFSKPMNLKKHIKRTVHLMVITLIWGVITVFIIAAIKHETITISEALNSVKNLKFHWVNHLWFMGSLVTIYALFPILKTVYDSNHRLFYYMTGFLFLLIFGTYTLNAILTMVESGFGTIQLERQADYDFLIWFNTIEMECPFALVYFCLGGILANFYPWLKAQTNAIKCVASTVVLVVFVLLSAWVNHLMNRCVLNQDPTWHGFESILTVPSVFAMAVLSIVFEQRTGKLSRLFESISKNTLGIYFVHMLIIHALSVTLGEALDIQNEGIRLLLSICVLGVSFLISKIMQKIPVIRQLVR